MWCLGLKNFYVEVRLPCETWLMAGSEVGMIQEAENKVEAIHGPSNLVMREEDGLKYLVYGATHGRGSGIGATVSGILLDRGHEILGLCRSQEKAASAAPFPLETLDMHSPNSEECLKGFLHDWNPDVIWFACGAGFDAPIWEMSDDDIDVTLDANVRVAARFCRACAPSCIDGGPHLILTGSIAGMVNGAGSSFYSGTKAFLVPFSRAQCREFAAHGKQAKVSVLAFNSVQVVGMEAIADALEFIGRQARPVEVLIR